MKVCIVSIIRPQPGSGDGITEYTYELCNALKKKGIQVKQIYALEDATQNNMYGLLYTHTIFKAKLRAALKEKYDIVHIAHNELGFVAKYLKQMKSPAKCVVTLHDFSKFKNELHKGVTRNVYKEIAKSSIDEAMRYSDFIILNSSQVEKDMLRFYGRLKNAKVIPSAMKESITKSIKREKPEKLFRVGYMGSFAAHKNVIAVLKVAKLLRDKDYKFSIYGRGTQYENLLDYADSNKLSNVHFMGFIDKDSVNQAYDSFDAFVFPSLHEGFGLPILEAQVRRIPVIIFKQSDIPDEIRRYCFEAKDEQEMATTLEELKYKGYDKKRMEIAARYAKKFGWSAVILEIISVYKKLLK